MSAIKDKLSLAYRLGKLLYPRRAPWEQRHKGAILIWTATIGIVLGFGVGVMMLLVYRNH
jgi:hypothetical protein